MAGEIEDNIQDLAVPADNVEPAREVSEPKRETPQKEEATQIKVGGKFDSSRQSVVEKLRAQREAEEAQHNFRAMPDEVERSRVGQNVETAADRAERRQLRTDVDHELNPPIRSVDDVKPPVTRKLKVHGREIEVDEEQLVAAAQKGLASDAILEEAKAARTLAQQQLAEIQAMRANQPQTPVPAAPSNAQSEDTKPDEAELDQIIDTIQVGDRKEAAAALAKYGEIIEQRLMGRIGDLDTRIEQTIQAKEVKDREAREADETVRSFMAEHQDFGTSEMRQKLLVDETVEVMLRNIDGLNLDGINRQTIFAKAAQLGIAPQVFVGRVYKDLARNIRLPAASENLRKAAENIRRDLGSPQPTPVPVPRPAADPNFMAQRQERKAAISPQPTRANQAPGFDPPPSGNTDEARRAAVRQMRAFRRGK